MTTQPIAVSAYVICQDAGETIETCLNSLRGFAEIVVVDSGSSDDTLEKIAQLRAAGLPIHVIERPWPGYSAQKQFAQDACRHRWCFTLDADEELDGDAYDEISRFFASYGNRNDEAAPAALRTRHWEKLPGYGFVHRWCRHKCHIRMIDRERANYDQTRLVHEGFILRGACHTARRGWILHHQDLHLATANAKRERYATLKAQQRAAKGSKPSYVQQFLSPPWYFLYNYLGMRYFLCGFAGLRDAWWSAQYAYIAAAKHRAIYSAQNKPAARSTNHR